jgi:hypothetical protein
MPIFQRQDQIQNDMVISVLEGQEILKRIQLCKADLFKGFPIDESDLDIHLENLIKFLENLFKDKQPKTKPRELPF